MTTRTDGEIQHDALDELTRDAAGQVSSYAEKRVAERLTEMIPGVSEVVVDVVTAQAFTDAELALAVRNALRWVA